MLRSFGNGRFGFYLFMSDYNNIPSYIILCPFIFGCAARQIHLVRNGDWRRTLADLRCTKSDNIVENIFHISRFVLPSHWLSTLNTQRHSYCCPDAKLHGGFWRRTRPNVALCFFLCTCTFSGPSGRAGCIQIDQSDGNVSPSNMSYMPLCAAAFFIRRILIW